jgi:hypothetical protein
MEKTTINQLIAAEREKENHQPREHPVPCRRCYRRRTWNTNGVCNGCSDEK